MEDEYAGYIKGPNSDDQHDRPNFTLYLIFVSKHAKDYFLNSLSDSQPAKIEVGASETEPLFDVSDISVTVYDENGEIVT